MTKEKLETLSYRQRQIYSYMLMGMTHKEIARHMKRSESCVRSHAMAIYRKLGVYNRLDLMSKAIQSNAPMPVVSSNPLPISAL